MESVYSAVRIESLYNTDTIRLYRDKTKEHNQTRQPRCRSPSLTIRSKILRVLAPEYLDWSAGLAFHCFNRHPEDGTPLPKHVADYTCHELYFMFCIVLYFIQRGRDSSVSIATRYGMDGPAIESRWGTRLSAPVQTDPGAHPASCDNGYWVFPGGKAAGAWC